MPKIDRIRSQYIRESCGIQPINESVERIRRRKRGEHAIRMDAERLVKISRDNTPACRRSPEDIRKEDNTATIPWLKYAQPPITKNKKTSITGCVSKYNFRIHSFL